MKNYIIAILISLSFLLQLEILLKGDVTFTDLLKLSKELRDILDPKVDKIYAGDIFAAVDIMNILNQQTSGTMKNITKEELTDFLEVRIIIDLIYYSLILHNIICIINDFLSHHSVGLFVFLSFICNKLLTDYVTEHGWHGEQSASHRKQTGLEWHG